MAGQSPLSATDEQRAALTALAGSRDRGEADRARAVLLTLAGWTSSHIAEAFGVRDDTVRLWRSDCMRDGVAAVKGTVAPGPAPVKSEATLRVVMPLLEAPVADRPNWTIPRQRAEFEAQAGVRISRSQLSTLASRRVRMRMWEIRTHADALAMVCSKSLASLRQRPSQVKVRSTTQRRGNTSKPLAVSERLMISMVQRPSPAKTVRSFSPA